MSIEQQERKYPPLPTSAKAATYADRFNTPAVAKGYEQGGYELTPPYYTADQMRAYVDAALAAHPQAPDCYALRFPSDARLCLSTVFDTQEEARTFSERLGSTTRIVPLYTHPAPQAAQAVPEEYQYRMKPNWYEKLPWTDWERCSPEAAADYRRIPLLHEWRYEVRELFVAPSAPAPVTKQFRKPESTDDTVAMEAFLSPAHPERKPLTDEQIMDLYYAQIGAETRAGFDDADAQEAVRRAVRAHLRSCQPKHEHKIAGVAYMISKVCEIKPVIKGDTE